jgi:hypothetical protein
MYNPTFTGLVRLFPIIFTLGILCSSQAGSICQKDKQKIQSTQYFISDIFRQIGACFRLFLLAAENWQKKAVNEKQFSVAFFRKCLFN